MNQFIGTKRLLAKPMSRGEYNTYRQWPMPSDENADDKGYLVEYLDGGKPNMDGHAGYVSWSPADQFENAYNHVNAMTFGHAVEMLKAGKNVARAGWNGKNMFLFLVPGSIFNVNRAPLLGIYEVGTEICYRSHIDMKTADDTVVPWVASQTDVLADDWMVIL